jgi:hypothetical protein
LVLIPAICMLIRPIFLGSYHPGSEISGEASNVSVATAAPGHKYHREKEKVNITENDIN